MGASILAPLLALFPFPQDSEHQMAVPDKAAHLRSVGSHERREAGHQLQPTPI
jgi:hypothetical protein